MFSISAFRYYLYAEPTDMRKSFDGLCGLVINRMHQNPVNGDVYIFINRQRNRIKLLRWEPGGFVLFYKRLEKGTYELPAINPGMPAQAIGYGQLAMIITGISLKNAKKRHRFLQQNAV
jgi:transposase